MPFSDRFYSVWRPRMISETYR